jgi:hypothetical protein
VGLSPIRSKLGTKASGIPQQTLSPDSSVLWSNSSHCWSLKRQDKQGAYLALAWPRALSNTATVPPYLEASLESS